MPLTLADRLNPARAKRFVGREDELRLFREALDAESPPFVLLSLHGPGGVGKTTLMNRFHSLCVAAGVPALLVDARGMDPTPAAFLAALRSQLPPDDRHPLQALAEGRDRCVLLIDNIEEIAALAGWLRGVFLPEQPACGMVVTAGRDPLPPAWRADPAWEGLIRTLPLRNLSDSESCRYLEERAVPAEQMPAVLDFTHGHPLALSLVADLFAQRPDIRFEPEAAPDVIGTLLERLTQKVPSPAHRAALEVCALLRTTRESLLAEMLQIEEPHDLFNWLRGLSFLETGRDGVSPHDMARDALVADMRWRNPEWHAELKRRARRCYDRRLRESTGEEQQRIIADYIYLTRDNPLVRAFVQWDGLSDVYADALRPEDVPHLLAMVREHEGEESAGIAERYIGRAPHETLVVRESTAASAPPAGFLCTVFIHETTHEDRLADPGVDAAWRFMESAGSPGTGQAATMFRFWMASKEYQGVSSTQSLILVNMVRHYLTRPGLALSFLPCSDVDFWGPISQFAEIRRFEGADFEVAGRHYGVYGQDWRLLPPLEWLGILGAKAEGLKDEPVRAVIELPVTLERDAFTRAVRTALKALNSPTELRDSPLLRSRFVTERAAGGTSAAREQALRDAIREATESLQAGARERRGYLALEATYLDPASSQEEAADRLDLPFSTYRRYLSAGIDAVTEILWRQETGM